MKHLFTALIALALLHTYSTPVQAAPLPPEKMSWTYNWYPGAASVLADGNPMAGISFTDEPAKKAVGSTDIVATNLKVFSTALAVSPDVLKANGDYALNLVLATKEGKIDYKGELKFTGKLSGSFSKESSNVKNKFLDGGPKSVDLGSYRFTVELVAYTPPGPPDQSNAGSIAAHVEITSLKPADVPEPTAILLSIMGASMLGGAALRKRRQTVAG